MIDDEDNVVLSIREELAREIPTLSQVKESLRKELDDPEISLYRNIRHMTLAQWDTFNMRSGMFEIPLEDIGRPQAPVSKKKRKVHARRSYHYKIGQYETSPYYKNFLSDEIVRIPGANDNTVRNQAKRLSLNPKSSFRSWFKMPLYKVEALAAQLIADEVIHLSRHCRTNASLHIKSELLVMGALAILAGSVTGFLNLPLLTHICATEHSKFFQRFVKYLFDKRNDYIYLPRNDIELRAVMK